VVDFFVIYEDFFWVIVVRTQENEVSFSKLNKNCKSSETQSPHTMSEIFLLLEPDFADNTCAQP
jgi:hypothetical protein